VNCFYFSNVFINASCWKQPKKKFDYIA